MKAAQQQTRFQSQDGFTLVEVLIAMSIGIMVMGFVLVFFIDSLRLSLGITNNLDIETSIRKITNELSQDARNANSFVIYKTFFDDGHELSGSFRNPSGENLSSSYRRQAGESGSFCVFVYNGEDETPLDLVGAPTERLVGYYLNNSDESEAVEIMKFDIDIASSRQFDSVEDLIPDPSDSEDHTVLVESANGLISGDLFFNLLGRSVIINSEIIYDLPSRTSGGTYNFTVSPRG